MIRPSPRRTRGRLRRDRRRIGARKGWATLGQATRASQALWMPRLFLISKTPSTRDRRQGPLEVGPEVLDVLAAGAHPQQGGRSRLFSGPLVTALDEGLDAAEARRVGQ